MNGIAIKVLGIISGDEKQKNKRKLRVTISRVV